MPDTEQEGVSPAAAAPDFNAIRDVVVDSLRAVPLWSFRQGLVAAGLIPADVEIQAKDRKPVSGEPGIDAEWDEDAEAMRVDGIGWDLSFGCKVSFAYDHAKGEYYVCVSTSDADQRAGITSRRTTKEQLASLGQQLLNVFGEPDPRDDLIERLRQSYELKVQDLARETARVSAALRACDHDANPWVGQEGGGYHAAQEAIRGAIERAGQPAGPDPRDAEIERLRDRVSQLSDEKRLQQQALDRMNRHQWDHAEGRSRRYSEVRDRIYRALGEEPPAVLGLWADLVKQVDRLIDVLDVEVRQHDQSKTGVEHWQRLAEQRGAQVEQFARDIRELTAERDRLRRELDARPGEAALRELADMLHAADDDCDRCQLSKVTIAHVRTLIACIASTSAEYRAECVRLGVENATVKAERDAMANGLVVLRKDFFAAVSGLLVAPKPTEPSRRGCPCKSQCDYLDDEDRCSDRCNCAAGRRWVAGDPEPEIGTTVRSARGRDYLLLRSGYWHELGGGCDPNSCRDAGYSWSWLTGHAEHLPLVEVVSADA